MNPLTLLHLIVEPRFLVGLTCGAVGLLVLLAIRGRGLGWFLVWTAASGVGLWWTGWLRGSLTTWDWAVLLGIGAVGGTAMGLRLLDQYVPSWSVGLLFGLTVLGVWGTVPDTEGATVLMGTTAGLLPALLGARGPRIDKLGYVLALTAVALVVIGDGVGRPGSIVGALGAFGMLLVAPAVLVAKRSPELQLSGWRLVAAQVLLVVLSGRVAGRVRGARLALVIWIVAAASVGIAWWLLEVHATKEGGDRGPALSRLN